MFVVWLPGSALSEESSFGTSVDCCLGSYLQLIQKWIEISSWLSKPFHYVIDIVWKDKDR